MEQKDIDDITKYLTERLRIDFNNESIEVYCAHNIINFDYRLNFTMTIGIDEKVIVDPKVSFSHQALQDIRLLHSINIIDEIYQSVKYEMTRPYNDAVRLLKIKMIVSEEE